MLLSWKNFVNGKLRAILWSLISLIYIARACLGKKIRSNLYKNSSMKGKLQETEVIVLKHDKYVQNYSSNFT